MQTVYLALGTFSIAKNQKMLSSSLCSCFSLRHHNKPDILGDIRIPVDSDVLYDV